MFIQNKYTKWYYNIISKALLRTCNDYIEKHHIIPKSLGGNNLTSNIVKLTAREHFICHILLTKMTSGSSKNKMIYAAHMMGVIKNQYQDRYINSRLYEVVKRDLSRILKERPYKGLRKQTEESNRKRSEKLKGRKLPPRTPEHTQKTIYKRTEKHRKHLSEIRKGVSWGKHSEEHKKEMSKRQKGIPQPTIQCKYCEIICSKMNHGRWHGNNCKHRLV